MSEISKIFCIGISNNKEAGAEMFVVNSFFKQEASAWAQEEEKHGHMFKTEK